MEKTIIHIDIDNFFINVEKILNPKIDIVNCPIVVSKNMKNGMVLTSNLKSRSLGITAGCPLFKAKAISKKLVVLNPHYKAYSEYSNYFINFLLNITKQVESYSIDECYIDITYLKIKKNKLYQFALNLQKSILDELKLNVTLGISYTKFLAKVATNLAKTNNICIIRHNNIKKLLWELPINNVFGIGNSTINKLNKIEIYKVKDLINYNNKELLKQILQKNYYTFIYNLFGLSNFNVNNNLFISKNKSISLSHTFNKNTKIVSCKFKKYIFTIFCDLINYLNANNLHTKCIKIKYKFNNSLNPWIMKQKGLKKYINNSNYLWECLNNFIKNNISNNENIKGFGIGFYNLLDEKISDYNIESKSINPKIGKIIRQVNKKMSNKLVSTGNYLYNNSEKHGHFE